MRNIFYVAVASPSDINLLLPNLRENPCYCLLSF